ncbi:MAG TPA: anaerobic ribonucleoside-triphosphate reductase [Spirochaetota bacterium]|nr:anaerobic ribonucleoside-triphosphate reductase [Spirochaetota bacterium]
MKSLQEIDKEILSLEEKLKNVKGTDTEVYTRIVGYHRSVTNWNKGKREEYDDRLTFKYNLSNPGNLISSLKEPETIKKEIVDSIKINNANVSFYKFFSSKTCRNCQPVKNYIEKIAIPGENIDVSTDLGMSSANKYNIRATPTVILFDANDNILGRGSSLEELKKFFS